MRNEVEHAQNERAYRGMKDELARVYPLKQFVAFGHGEIIGNSAAFDELLDCIRRQGRDPREVMVIRVGDTDLDGATIFTRFPSHMK